MKQFDYNKYLKNNPLLKEVINEATVRDMIKPIRSKLESMGYEVDVDTSFGFPLIEAFKTLPDGSVLRMTVQPSEDEIQKKIDQPVVGETIDVTFTLWTTKVTKKLFGLYKQKTSNMQNLPDEAGINIDLGTGMFDIPVEQSVEKVISLLKKAEQKVGAGTPTRQMTGDADADFMGEGLDLFKKMKEAAMNQGAQNNVNIQTQLMATIKGRSDDMSFLDGVSDEEFVAALKSLRVKFKTSDSGMSMDYYIGKPGAWSIMFSNEDGNWMADDWVRP